MQYHLTHRGQTLATFEIDPTELNDVRITRAVKDTLPPMPEGYSMMADVEKAKSEPCSWHRPRKHSTRASSWL